MSAGAPSGTGPERSAGLGRSLSGGDTDLDGRLYGLLIGLDDRIDSEQAQLLHHFIDVGEYGLALEEIAGRTGLQADLREAAQFPAGHAQASVNPFDV